MATKYEQELVSQYGSGIQDYINQQRTLGKSGALRGSNVDKQDVQRIVAGYQAIAPVPTPQICVFYRQHSGSSISTFPNTKPC
jgi:hypothetical protein